MGCGERTTECRRGLRHFFVERDAMEELVRGLVMSVDEENEHCEYERVRFRDERGEFRCKPASKIVSYRMMVVSQV